MKYNYYINDKTIITCVHCLNRLRIPTNKGKISVKCPVCKKEFVFNPNSVLHTLRQIFLSIMPRNRKQKRTLAIILAAALVVLALFIVFSTNHSNPGRDAEQHQGPVVYYTEQKYPYTC